MLGVLYESYIHPITILSTLPSAGIGALLAMMLFHQDLNLVSLIGIILLIGIVKKNGIMMVDFALAAERQQGLTPEQSIYQACLLRFRPIMMTTMAALLGRPAAGGRHRHRLGTAASARHRGRRRPPGVAVSHALCDARRLPRLRADRATIYAQSRANRREPTPGSTPPGRDEVGPRRGHRGMNFSAPFVRRPIATTLLTVAVALLGVIAYCAASDRLVAAARTPDDHRFCLAARRELRHHRFRRCRRRLSVSSG